MSAYSTQANLIKMANQISTFFESQTPADTAASAQALAAHLKLFWAPAMRSRLVDQIERDELEGVHPVVESAVRRHRATLVAEQAHVRAEAALLQPAGGGDAG